MAGVVLLLYLRELDHVAGLSCWHAGCVLFLQGAGRGGVGRLTPTAVFFLLAVHMCECSSPLLQAGAFIVY